MLDTEIKEKLKPIMEKLVDTVVLNVALDKSVESNNLKLFLEDIEALSDKIMINMIDDITEKTYMPFFTIENKNKECHIKFVGAPSGHEFDSFILALLQVSGAPIKITNDLKKAIASIDYPCDFTTYMLLSCPNCPDVVQALNVMAVLNPHVSHTAIDANLFPDEMDKLDIQSVPTVYLDDELFLIGRTQLRDILIEMGKIEK